VEALRKKERQDETQFITKIDGFLSFISCWMLTYVFAGFFWNVTLCMIKLRVLVLCFSYFTDNSNITGYLNFFYKLWLISQNRAFEFFENCNYRLQYPAWYPEGVTWCTPGVCFMALPCVCRSRSWNPVPETQVLRAKYRGPETQVLGAKYRGPETQVLRAKYRGPETQVLRAFIARRYVKTRRQQQKKRVAKNSRQ
jgi:hypothetical protein